MNCKPQKNKKAACSFSEQTAQVTYLFYFHKSDFLPDRFFILKIFDVLTILFILQIFNCLTDTSSAPQPYLSSPTADPDHYVRNVRKLLSACRSGGADRAS